MMKYWLDKHGDIDGTSSYDEQQYREDYPEMMQARDLFLYHKQRFHEEVEKIDGTYWDEYDKESGDL